MSEASETRNPARWLIASFLMNALLLGLIIGIFLAGPHRAGSKAGPPAVQVSEEDIMRRLVQSVPPEERRAVRQQLRQTWIQARPQRERYALAGQRVIDAIRAEPYDRGEMAQALSDWRTAEQDLKATIQETIAELLARLPAERRQALADELVQRAQRRAMRGREPRPPSPRRDPRPH